MFEKELQDLMMEILFICFHLLWMFSTSTSARTPPTLTVKGPLVLLVSFDGFRWDYLDRTETPNFDILVASGVKSQFVYDTFVSKTFPNHYTIATGLYQESHGILGNVMYDPVWNETFDSKQAKWWNSGEPIWETNRKHGHKSAVIMYPGMSVPIHGHFADYRLPKYDENFPFEERSDLMTQLFANDSVNLGLLYFHEPDHFGHMLGPSSPEMIPIIQMCDRTLGYLVKKLKDANLWNRVDVIVTSDHGMTDVSREKEVQLDDFVDPSLYIHTDNNPVHGIFPLADNFQTIYEQLHNMSQHVTVYKKDEIPAEYHYHDNRRVPPILLVADEGWSIRRGNQSGDLRLRYRGNHGYNNSLISMHPIFMAHGPSFKKGVIIDPFENVDIYPLMCKILGIEPAPNNGSLEKVQALLRLVEVPTSPPSPDWSTGTTIGIAVAIAIAVVAGCLLLAMCVRQRSYQQTPRDYTPIADTSLDVVDNVEDSTFIANNYPNTKL